MWLQLRRIKKKKFTEGNARKFNVSFAFCPHIDVRANCFCASLLRMQIHTQSHTSSARAKY